MNQSVRNKQQKTLFARFEPSDNHSYTSTAVLRVRVRAVAVRRWEVRGFTNWTGGDQVAAVVPSMHPVCVVASLASSAGGTCLVRAGNR